MEIGEKAANQQQQRHAKANDSNEYPLFVSRDIRAFNHCILPKWEVFEGLDITDNFAHISDFCPHFDNFRLFDHVLLDHLVESIRQLIGFAGSRGQNNRKNGFQHHQQQSVKRACQNPENNPEDKPRLIRLHIAHQAPVGRFCRLHEIARRHRCYFFSGDFSLPLGLIFWGVFCHEIL